MSTDCDDIFAVLQRTTRTIARKHGADPDDTLQEALIAAWRASGSPRRKMRYGNYRALEYAYASHEGGRHAFGHPGGRAGSPTKKMIAGEPLEHDALITDTLYEPGELRSAISTLSPLQQHIAWDISIGTPPGLAAKDLSITSGYYRIQRAEALRKLRSHLDNPRVVR